MGQLKTKNHILNGQQGRLVTWVRERSPLTIGLRIYAQIMRIIVGAPLLKYSRINDVMFIGGQHRVRGLSILRDVGITAIVNLRFEYDDRERGIGMDSHLYLPVRDNRAPTIEQLGHGVTFITQHASVGERVYIHCGVGVGRAPTLAAAYLVSTGYEPKEAWRVIREVRPFILPVRSQIIAVEQYAQHLRDYS